MEQNWYEKSWATVLFLIVFSPVGLYLMWKYNRLNKIAKILITIFFMAMWGTYAGSH